MEWNGTSINLIVKRAIRRNNTDFLFSRLVGWESGRNKVKVHTPMGGQTKNPTNVGLSENLFFIILF